MTGIQPDTATGSTPESHRERAAAHNRAAADSFERCDTDGFVSQWAHGIMGEKERLAAKIAENGGYHRFTALYGPTGEILDAREVQGKFGWFWSITDADGTRRTFNESNAAKWRQRIRTDARKGVFVGSALFPAYADTVGSGTGLAGAHTVRAVAVRRFKDNQDYVILDNGAPDVAASTILAEWELRMSRYEWDRIPDNERAAYVANQSLARKELWRDWRPAG